MKGSRHALCAALDCTPLPLAKHRLQHACHVQMALRLQPALLMSVRALDVQWAWKTLVTLTQVKYAKFVPKDDSRMKMFLVLANFVL